MTKVLPGLGASVPRLDAPETVAGEAIYTDDISRPGMLHAVVVQSTVAHARVKRVDVSKALALPGVKATVTARDFPKKLSGGFVRDETILAVDKVRYVGDAVAAIAATDIATARAAARLVEVDYEELPAILTIDDALAPGAALVHEELDKYFSTRPGKGTGNTLWDCGIEEGDVDAAWARCDTVVEGTFELPAQHHLYMEPTAAFAEPDRQGRVTVWASMQSVALAQQRVAEWLGIPMSKIRMLAPRVGGGFGGKGSPHFQPLAAALALRTGRPVKLTLTRTEDFEMMRSRHPARIRMKTGATKDGTLVAREFDAVLDAGAYADDSPGVVSVAALMGRGPYNIPHVRARSRGVYTNKLRAGAYRGFGNPQISFAAESQLDEIAARLRLDPVALRLKNAMRPGDRWLGGQTVEGCAFTQTLHAVKKAATEAKPLAPPRPGVKRAVGYSAFAAPHGLLATSVHVMLRGDGSVALNTGVIDIGQGSTTVLSQMAAEVLKLSVDQVSFAQPDSDSSPYDWKSAASRVTYMAGRATVAATEDVKKQILKHASEMMEAGIEDLELRPGGRVGIAGVPQKEVPFAMIAGRAHYMTGGPIAGKSEMIYDRDAIDPKRAKSHGLAFGRVGTYSFGAQAVETDVDTATGEVRVLRAWSAHDIGRAINPSMVDGQIVGGFVHGLGYAVYEEMVWDGGRLANPTLMDYKIPTVLEAPEVIPIVIEEAEPSGPFGAKGIGEPPLVGVAPAIASAIAAATGARVRQVPMTPERVLNALEPES